MSIASAGKITAICKNFTAVVASCTSIRGDHQIADTVVEKRTVRWESLSK